MNPILLLLEEGVECWNQWRAEHPNTPCSLAGCDLTGAYCFGADFSGVNLDGVNLQRACLIGADLRWANLRGADLRGAYMDEVNLYGANLNDAQLTGASLDRADLRQIHWLGEQVSRIDAEELGATNADISTASSALNASTPASAAITEQRLSNSSVHISSASSLNVSSASTASALNQVSVARHPMVPSKRRHRRSSKLSARLSAVFPQTDWLRPQLPSLKAPLKDRMRALVQS
jgi:hypothetical protein